MPPLTRLALLCLLLSALPVTSPAATGPGAAWSPGPHALEERAHGPTAARVPTASFHFREGARPPLSPKTDGLARVVYGYLPYWEFDYENWQWDALTHVAYFAVGIGTDGQLSGALRGWCDEFCDALRDEAHAHGVRLHLAITNFDSGGLATLLNTPSAAATAVETIRTLVLAGQADGVNIDFEGLPVSARDSFVTFIRDLRAALRGDEATSEVTIATPAVDWSGAFDYDQLALAADGLMVMAYNYHWAGGNPGPVSPLTRGEVWGEKTIEWTVGDYLEWAGAENRHKIWLGLPWYGFDWPTTGPEIPGTAASDGSAVFFRTADAEAAVHGGWQWDAHSQSPYFTYQDGSQWHQLWCDTPQSFALRLDYVNEMDLGGIGIWALGYDGDNTEFWDDIRAAFGSTEPTNERPVAVADAAAEARVGERVLLDGGASYDPDGDPLTFVWRQDSGTEVVLEHAERPVASFVATAPGVLRFSLTVDDGLEPSLPASIAVTIHDDAPVADPSPDAGPDRDAGAGAPAPDTATPVADTAGLPGLDGTASADLAPTGDLPVGDRTRPDTTGAAPCGSEPACACEESAGCATGATPRPGIVLLLVALVMLLRRTEPSAAPAGANLSPRRGATPRRGEPGSAARPR